MPPSESTQQQRSADRYGFVLPVTLEGQDATIHDLSRTGVLVESSMQPEVGSHVSLSLHYRARGADHQLDCVGQVMRVERHGDAFNIAVQLTEPLFDDD